MDARLTVHPAQRLGTISPLVYGLRGADVFKNDTPLMWVGPDSSIANIGGIRGGALARPEDSMGSGGAAAGSAIETLPELPMLSASASVAEDGSEAVVTITNCHLIEPARVRLDIEGKPNPGDVQMRTLAASQVRDFNDVANPARVGIRSRQPEPGARGLTVEVAPFSVNALRLTF